jgi:hypothetical protein
MQAWFDILTGQIKSVILCSVVSLLAYLGVGGGWVGVGGGGKTGQVAYCT